jgi:nucleoside phosphorylase/CheY-like chemotaxis protein
MRVLIVDDDAVKATCLKDELILCGVKPIDIVLADCVVAARSELHHASFDAMLLDVLLPTRRHGKPSADNSVELLREIINDGSTKAPRYMLGVTADLTALTEHAGEFERLTSNVLLVNPSQSAWKGSLRNLIAFINRVDAQQGVFDYDICVLNALKAPELDAVLDSWPLTLGSDKLLNRSVIYRDGTCRIADADLRIVCGYPAQMGPIAATHAATSMLTAFRPRVLIMTGICGGFSDHVSIGDVVIAERSWDWQSGKWSEDGVLLAAPDHREADAELLSWARMLQGPRFQELVARFDGSKPSHVNKLVIGPMVTGSSVVASKDIQAVFRAQHRKMVAVDMECYGLYYTTSMLDGPSTKVLCVKSVSDLADRGKADDFHKFCSHMSSMVALELLNNYFASDRADGRTREDLTAAV